MGETNFRKEGSAMGGKRKAFPPVHSSLANPMAAGEQLRACQCLDGSGFCPKGGDALFGEKSVTPKLLSIRLKDNSFMVKI